MSDIELFIRDILPSDTEEVLEVYRNAIHAISFPTYDITLLNELASRSYEEFNRLGLTRSRYVAILDNQIVGYSGLDKNKSILTECYVSPQYGGKGIGARLVKRVQEEAIKSGITVLTVLSSLNAVGFYERQGFLVKNTSYLPMNNGVKMKCMLLEKSL